MTFNSAKISRRGFVQSATVAGIGSAIGLSAGGIASVSAQEKKKLVVASFYPTNETSGWDGLIRAFSEKYPDVEVEVQVTSGSEYLPKILSQKASGTLPDIIAVENNDFSSFADADLLLGLNERMEETTDFTVNDFPARLIERFTWNDTLYGIPYDVQPIAGVFLNKGLFNDAGVDVPTGDWTWDEFMEIAEAMTKRDDNRTSVYGLDPGTDRWQNWIFAHDGALVDNPQLPTVVTTDSQAAIDGMNAFIDLSLNAGISPKRDMFAGGGVTSGDLFAAGQTAMFIGGYWEVVSYPGRWDAIDLGYVLMPAGPNGSRGYQTGGTCYSVSSGSQVPDIAFDFVRFFMGMEGWRAASESSATIYPPAFIPAFNEIFLADPNSPVENKALNGEAAEFAIFAPADVAWREQYQTRITPDMDLIAAGSLDPAEAMTAWAADITPLLKANQ